MKSFSSILAYSLLPALVVSQATGDICHSDMGYGICETTSWCASYSGAYDAGYCPDAPNDVECCIAPACDNWNGICEYTPEFDCLGIYGGTYESGYCPGPSNYKCCVM